MFMVRKLLELGRKARVPLFPCSIDVQKACVFVDQELFWQVLARFGVPYQIIEVIFHFHDGMRACMRNDNGQCSEWFELIQRLRHGCMFPQLLFNVFFAVIYLVALQIFCKDADVLADFVHLQEQPSKVGPETALDCVRRAIWGCCMLTTRTSCRGRHAGWGRM